MSVTSDESRFSGFTRQDFERISFDYTKLAERLAAAEDWAKLVVCHIYLDHILTQTLRDNVPKIDFYFDGGHKSFADKLALCKAHELVDDEIATTLKSINNARNKFAHRLVFEVPDEMKMALFLEFSPTRAAKDVLGAEGFSNFLFTVVMLLEFERIFDIKIAKLKREAEFHREKMLELAKQMVGRRM